MLDFIADWGSIIGLVVALLALFWTIKLEIKRRQYRILWEDVTELTRKIAKIIIKKRFHPDIIVAIGGPPVIVAELILIELDEFIPLYVANQIIRKRDEKEGIYDHIIVTTKWRTTIPKECLDNQNARVLIVEDFIPTGDTSFGIKKIFINRGFDNKNIRIATLLVSDTVTEAKKVPHFIGEIVNTQDIKLPWGPALKGSRIAMQRHRMKRQRKSIDS